MIAVVLLIFVACFLLEQAIPGWRLPRVRTWPLRVVAVNIVQLGIVVLAGITWERWLSSASLFHLSPSAGPGG